MRSSPKQRRVLSPESRISKAPPRFPVLILLSVLRCCFKSWSEQTGDGPAGGSSRSEYVTVPAKVPFQGPSPEFIPLLLSSFRSASSDTHSQGSEASLGSLLSDSPDRDARTGTRTGSMILWRVGCLAASMLLMPVLTLMFVLSSPQGAQAWTACRNIQATCAITSLRV